jgi:hypothetical protein
VTLSTLSSKGAEQVLESFGYKVTHLKNGSDQSPATRRPRSPAR